MVKIRLRRMGSRNHPAFRIIVSDSRRAPTSAALEELGYYDPDAEPAVFELDRARYDYWLEHGAQASDTIRTLVANVDKTGSAEPVSAPPAAETTPETEETAAADEEVAEETEEVASEETAVAESGAEERQEASSGESEDEEAGEAEEVGAVESETEDAEASEVDEAEEEKERTTEEGEA